MWKPIVLAGLVLAAPLATAAPAVAQTGARICIAAIRTANARHKAQNVPEDCWRMGPLTLGMKQAAAERALGPPDGTQAASVTYRRRKFALTRAFYVYPRNLRNWLRLAPEPDFHPVTLSLVYYRGSLVALSAGTALNTEAGTCVPRRRGTVHMHRTAGFPFDFHGIAPGSSLAQVTGAFGRFAEVNPSRDFFNYWPVPLAVEGESKVDGIEIATGMAFVRQGGVPDFRVTRDVQTCLVTGFTLAPAK